MASEKSEFVRGLEAERFKRLADLIVKVSSTPREPLFVPTGIWIRP